MLLHAIIATNLASSNGYVNIWCPSLAVLANTSCHVTLQQIYTFSPPGQCETHPPTNQDPQASLRQIPEKRSFWKFTILETETKQGEQQQQTSERNTGRRSFPFMGMIAFLLGGCDPCPTTPFLSKNSHTPSAVVSLRSFFTVKRRYWKAFTCGAAFWQLL